MCKIKNTTTMKGVNEIFKEYGVGIIKVRFCHLPFL